jgi:hypothetical protein
VKEDEAKEEIEGGIEAEVVEGRDAELVVLVVGKER